LLKHRISGSGDVSILYIGKQDPLILKGFSYTKPLFLHNFHITYTNFWGAVEK